MKTIRVGLLGCGTVGTGVAKLLIEKKELISSRVGADIHLKHIADIDVTRDRGVRFDDGVLIADAYQVVTDPEIDIIIELIGAEIAFRMFAQEPIGFFNGAIGPQRGGCEDQLRSQRAQDFFALVAGRLGHGQTQLVSFGGGNHRQADPRVAAGRFENNLVRIEVASSFRPFNHKQGRAVFHGTAGIGVFELGINLHGRVGIDTPDLHQRRISDAAQYALIGFNHIQSSAGNKQACSFKRHKGIDQPEFRWMLAVHLGKRNLDEGNPFTTQMIFLRRRRGSANIAFFLFSGVDFQRDICELIPHILEMGLHKITQLA